MTPAPVQCSDCWLVEGIDILNRPVARIFRRGGVTWMSKLHKHRRLGGSGSMLPQEIFRN